MLRNGEKRKKHSMNKELTQQPQDLRLPPHSAEAEASVLGSILLDHARSIDLCTQSKLDEDAFHLPIHKTIYECMLKMHSEQKAIDLVTLAEYMASTSKLQVIGGPITLEQLINTTPTIAHIEYYISILREKHQRRKIIAHSRATEQAAYTSTDPAETIIAQAEESVMQLTNQIQTTTKNWKDILRDTMDKINRLAAGEKGAAGLTTGITNIDNKILGLKQSELIIIAARPSQGKTSLAMNIAQNIAQGNTSEHTSHHVAVFSSEMSDEALAMRIICGTSQINSHQIAQGHHISQEQQQRLKQTYQNLQTAKLHIDDQAGLDIAQVRSRARRFKQKYNIQLIIIDYLQLLSCREYSKQGRQLETMAISGQLKAMAKELKIPVIALSQLSRATETHNNGIPRLSDLRDSGAIEQDADLVALLRRPAKNGETKYQSTPNLAILEIAKQRNGPTGEIYLHFQDQYTTFKNATDPNISPLDKIKQQTTTTNPTEPEAYEQQQEVHLFGLD